MRTKKYFGCMVLLIVWVFSGCAPKLKLFPDAADPLVETTISGLGSEKVLVIPVNGILSDTPKKGLFETPSQVQEVVSQLQLAEKDSQVKAVVIKINSPGGSATASDIIYHEIMAFKRRRPVKVLAVMMDLATSGGYYVALPADYIMAHPTTITGSVGVIMLMPKVDGLMAKIGVTVDVQKSGQHKDMASPFRPSTTEERRYLQQLTDVLGDRFIRLVAEHRRLKSDSMEQVASARLFIAEEALSAGLVDGIGYLSDALQKARELAGLPAEARVVVYRRTRYADDNLYNSATTQTGSLALSPVTLDLPGNLSSLDTGFYYLWLPALTNK